MHEKKRLYKSEKDSVISGVIGGVGEFFELDASLLRLFWVLVVVFTGFFPGIIAYIIASLVVPLKN
ncbi:MAG: PspC domain-containing protein [Candidatus Niyogibacteria bacterium]|nr:PspC domain-containing protein [Candidatus Niyogibacteria bacterium]